MVNCCVCFGCSNSSLSGHRVHRFPNRKNGALFRAWVHFVERGRSDFSSAAASRNAVVCGAHFRPEDYNPGDLRGYKMGCRSKQQIRLLPWAVPSFTTSSPAAPPVGHGPGRHSPPRKRGRERTQRDAGRRLPQQMMVAGVMWDHDYAMFTEEQTLDRNYTHLRSRFGLRRFASSDEEIRFHTGFATYQLLSAFWELVEPGGADVAASPVTTNLLPFDELLLFLMHLSSGPSLADLSQRFGIESIAVSGVISSWTHFLFRLLGSQRLWIPPKAVRAHLPPEFAAFSDTQVVLHCVQIFCRARVPLGLQSTNPACFKALVGLAPHGPVTFVSGLFARSVSDLEIFRRSGLSELLTADAAVMVDRGFLIDDVAPCRVHRPAFFYRCQRTSSKRGGITPPVARLMIHVRTCLASLKENQLFNMSAPLCVGGCLEELFSVACYLVNYQKRPRQRLCSRTHYRHV